MTSTDAMSTRMHAVEWHDLVPLSRAEVVKELLLSTPWLLASLLIARAGGIPLAFPFSFVFFLTGLRQVHNAHHYALGVSRRATEAVMFVLSLLMLSSMHAIQVTHLHHHRHCLDHDDVEAESARMSALEALAFGPVFAFRIHAAALRLGGSRHRRWIGAELAGIGIVLSVACWIRAPWLLYHVAAMLAGQCMTAFFAVWTVHHHCDGTSSVARTLRSRLKSIIVFDMFYHLEHHLFPKVPTCHLAILAERIDRAAPDQTILSVY